MECGRAHHGGRPCLPAPAELLPSTRPSNTQHGRLLLPHRPELPSFPASRPPPQIRSPRRPRPAAWPTPWRTHAVGQIPPRPEHPPDGPRARRQHIHHRPHQRQSAVHRPQCSSKSSPQTRHSHSTAVRSESKLPNETDSKASPGPPLTTRAAAASSGATKSPRWGPRLPRPWSGPTCGASPGARPRGSRSPSRSNSVPSGSRPETCAPDRPEPAGPGAQHGAGLLRRRCDASPQRDAVVPSGPAPSRGQVFPWLVTPAPCTRWRW